ncbi:hypothetical protein A7U60_g6835 [Sanghuangporus baumii]|uniref:Uncharacterized protein n=1 Tax=Sanghuangporus baumii TaxID=108892 RepID=A0A9Q5HUL5_SANBA|nr:hypothetical protein A7U60_g6835 [Sanghuangporus baumii]
MSALFDVLECAPFAAEREEVETISFPNFTSLFLEADANVRCRSSRELRVPQTILEEDEEESDNDDDDDGETIIWITPRARPHKQGLQEPDDGFSLDEPPSPADIDFSTSSSSSNSSEGSTSGEHHRGPISSDRLVAQSKPDEFNEDENDDEWVNIEDEELEDELDDDSSGDSSGLSSDDEEESVLSLLFRQEDLLGHEFVYIDEAYLNNNYETSLSVEDIIYGVHRTCDTYVAAMRLYLKWVDLKDEGDEAQARQVLMETQTAANGSIEDWLSDCPEDNWPLGRARCALIGQLIRLELLPETYISQLITRMRDELYLDGRMQVLQALIHYAGPRAVHEANLDAIDIIADFCKARPGLYMMRWLFSNSFKKIKKDISTYMLRNRLTDDQDSRFTRTELESLLRGTLEGDESNSLYRLLDVVLDQRDQRMIANLM